MKIDNVGSDQREQEELELRSLSVSTSASNNNGQLRERRTLQASPSGNVRGEERCESQNTSVWVTRVT